MEHYKIYYWNSEFDRNQGNMETWEESDNLNDAIEEARDLYGKGIACVEVRDSNSTLFRIYSEFDYETEGEIMVNNTWQVPSGGCNFDTVSHLHPFGDWLMP